MVMSLPVIFLSQSRYGGVTSEVPIDRVPTSLPSSLTGWLARIVKGTTVPATMAAAGVPSRALTTVSWLSTLSLNFLEWPRPTTVPFSSVTVMKSEPDSFMARCESRITSSWLRSRMARARASSFETSIALCAKREAVWSLAVRTTFCRARILLSSSSSRGSFMKWMETHNTTRAQMLNAISNEPTNL